MNPIEDEIKAKGLTAPRVTPDDLEANIAREAYFTAADGVVGAHLIRHYRKEIDLSGGRAETLMGMMHPSELTLTFCVLVLNNGFTVTGESACASPENFDPEIGRKIARGNAKEKIWPLMGYALKQKLSEAK
jgi:hypothetical protein